MAWAPLRGRKATFDEGRTYVMGVVNVTPDSFSDGGRHASVAAATDHARFLMGEGADLLDVGGESTRPGAEPVDAETEWARVAPVLAALADVPAPLSIDTYKAAVAERALAAGAEVVNDVSGGRLDPRIREVVAARDAIYVVGHLRGTPRTMQWESSFTHVFEEVAAELADSVARARAAGVRQLIADPGIGFGKTDDQNLELIARAGELGDRLGVPVLLGPSRKGFLGRLAGRPDAPLPVDQRLPATLAAVVAGALAGASFVRVHEVAPARQALAVADAVARASFRTAPSGAA